MEHIRSFLLAAMALMVAVAAAVEATTTAALSPLPSTLPADTPQPEIPPCLNDLMACASVYDDSSMLAPCCDAVGKVLKSDPGCLCQVFEMARNNTKQLGSNALDGDQQMFARCKIPGTSSTICDNGQAGHGTPAGDSSTGVLSL
uniref:Bifunctional inhibitor/plant lipid transfer protein/seed storage helical domain-containing protein n=1 Tax=Oryza punctata TaxID=4537 RepID=A0A0E0M684_ORYPU